MTEIKLHKKFYSGEDVINAILAHMETVGNLPAADVVEVVRCKDCKLWGSTLDEEDRQRCIEFNTDLVCDYWMSDGLMPDDYCSKGERKEGGK